MKIQSMMNLVSSSPKSLLVLQPTNNLLFSFQNIVKHLKLRNRYYCTTGHVAPTTTISSRAQDDVVTTTRDDKHQINNNDANVGIIPKHVALCLDGNRRWLKFHGLDLDYRPSFQAHMRFFQYCLKWGVTSATSYIYGLGNMKHRTKEASDLIIGQFEEFLDDGLDVFIRNGVKVSIVGELSMLPESCQAKIKRVEEATKNNTVLDLVLPTCYTSQRDIVEATKKICKKVKEGTMEFEDIDEDMIEQHLLVCGSRPPLDLFIRTGGQLRIGMLLGWQIPHAELFFTDIYAPDFGEDTFLEALTSYQQRSRWFAK